MEDSKYGIFINDKIFDYFKKILFQISKIRC